MTSNYREFEIILKIKKNFKKLPLISQLSVHSLAYTEKCGNATSAELTVKISMRSTHTYEHTRSTSLFLVEFVRKVSLTKVL